MKFDNQIVNDYLQDNNLQVIKFDRRPWGGWYLIENYPVLIRDRKVLHVTPGTLLSLQYHGTASNPGHREIWDACTKIRALISTRPVIGLSKEDFEKCVNELLMIDLEPHAKLYIGPGFIHALINPYANDLYVIETRESIQPESSDTRENNISRIYDQTNRGGIPAYPTELSQKIMDPNSKPDFVVKSGELFEITI